METEEIKVMKRIGNGATVWGRFDAEAVRELQKNHPEWVTIIVNMEELEKIMGEKYSGVGELPYFGAILTAKGKEALAAA